MEWGMGKAIKRGYFKELLLQERIDIVAIQETQKEDLTQILLRTLSRSISSWIYLPSCGRSGVI
jgi:hypothetical protein